MNHENENLEDLPQSLVDELKAADQPISLLTARVDREISRMSRDHFSNREQRDWRLRPAWVAVAATILLALFVIPLRDKGIPGQAPIYADVDDSGRIDIADVLMLARTRNAEEISQAEIDAFAMQIVSLSPVGDTS